MKALTAEKFLLVCLVLLAGAWSAFAQTHSSAGGESGADYNRSELNVSIGVNRPKETTEGNLCPDCEKRAVSGRLGDDTRAPARTTTPAGEGGSSSGQDGSR